MSYNPEHLNCVPMEIPLSCNAIELTNSQAIPITTSIYYSFQILGIVKQLNVKRSTFYK